MDEFKRIKVSSLLILLLQFTGTAIGQRVLYLSVRVGDEATSPCDNVIHDQHKCESTTWLFSDSVHTAAVALVKDGQIGNHAKSDRLRVTEKCSLVIKKVTEEDAGHYVCRHFRSGEHQGSDSQVYLSVVTMTEQQDKDRMWLRCSVRRYVACRHSVKWLLQGQDVDKDHREIETSQSDCSVSVIFPTSHNSYTTWLKFFTCAVTADGGNVQTFSFQSSDGDKQQAATTTTTTTNTSGRINNPEWWLYMVLALVLVALLITIVAFITWRKMKGKEARESDSVGQTSNPAVNSPETNPATADPEEGVCYASITYTKNTHKKAEVKIENDADEGDEVTYSTVKASTNEPSSLNDTI